MVASIDVAIILHDPSMTACFSHCADTRLLTNPVGQGGVEKLDVVVSYIVTHPFVKDGAEKMAPLLRCDREVGQWNLLLISRTGQITSVSMWKNTFHDRGKLNIVALYLLEEVVEIQRIVGIEVIDYGQGIPLYIMFLQQVDTSPHLLKRGQPLLVSAVFVMKLLRTIDRDPHQPIILLEEAAPLISQQRAVGLNGVVNGSARPILLLQFNHPFVERKGPHQRLSPMPGEKHLRHGLRFNILLDEKFEQLITHRELARGLAVLI